MSSEKTTTISAALSEAQSIIDAAEKRAKEILAEAEQVNEEAKEEGFQKGFERGQAEAIQAALKLISDNTAIKNNLAHEAAQLAITICSMIIDTTLKIAPETILGIAKRALRESMIGDVATFIVHPQDQPIISASLESLQRFAGGGRIDVETDETITRGGCIVKTEFGEVDARIEALLDAVSHRLGLGGLE